MDKESEIQEEVPQQLPEIEELTAKLTDAERKQLSILGKEITTDDAEELSRLFPREIPKIAVEKQNVKSRLKEIFLLPKKLQKWRKR